MKLKTLLFLLALAVSGGLNIYLFQRYTSADKGRQVAEQHFTDCQQVTFQLQNELSEAHKSAEPK